MKRRWLRLAVAAVVAAVPVVPGWSADAAPPGKAGAPTRPAAADVVTLNFVNADIEGVVKAVGEITGKNFVIDPRVKGTVTIVSARPLSRSLVYDVFLSALRVQGFAAMLFAVRQSPIRVRPGLWTCFVARPVPERGWGYPGGRSGWARIPPARRTTRCSGRRRPPSPRR